MLKANGNAKAYKIKSNVIAISKKENYSAIKLDSNLSIKSHVTNLCKKAGQKPHALLEWLATRV